MRVRALIVAAVVCISVPASAQLEASYADPDAAADGVSSSPPKKAPEPPPPRRPPNTIGYERGMPIPAGYHLERRSGERVMIVGGVMMGAGALCVGLGVLVAALEPYDNSGAGLAVLAGGAVVIGGLAVLAIGHLLPARDLLVRDRVAIAPVVGRDVMGGGASFTF